MTTNPFNLQLGQRHTRQVEVEAADVRLAGQKCVNNVDTVNLECMQCKYLVFVYLNTERHCHV